MHVTVARDRRKFSAQRRRTTSVAEIALILLAIAACSSSKDTFSARQVPGGHASNGRNYMAAAGCGSCHIIPGVVNARGMVGPSLEHFAQRSFIAGEVPNTTDNLVKWIVNPPSIEPKTAMPVLGVTPTEARDIAAYLYQLR
jgi:cytochrome c